MKRTIRKLGVFDSGIGGLTVLKELLKLPIPEFIYVADTANLPYGEKTADQVTLFTSRVIAYLTTHHVDAVVIACHTASAIALEHIQTLFPDVLIIGVVDPVVQRAVTVTQTMHIGVIGTPATIASGIHALKIRTHLPDAFTFLQACPRFVPLIEDGLLDKHAMKLACQEYLTPLQHCDTVIIGCTHYELIVPEINEFFGDTVQIVSAPYHTATLVKDRMENSSDLSSEPHVTYHVTGDVDQFTYAATQLTGLLLNNVSQIELSEKLYTNESLTRLRE